MNEKDSKTTIIDFIDYLVKAIVSKPEDVMVERNMNTYEETYVIHVNQDDMGVIIGKSGKNINAIRNLVSIRSGLKKVFVHIAENIQ